MVDTKKQVKKSNLTERQRRKQIGARPSRSFASLENTSMVCDPITKRNRVRTKAERKLFLMKKNKIAKDAVSSVQDQIGIAKQISSRNVVDRKRKSKYPSKDIWVECNLRGKFQNEWIDKNVEEYHLMNTGKPKIIVPKSLNQVGSQLK